MKVQDMISPRDANALGLLSVRHSQGANAYTSVMQYVDKQHADSPATCSGGFVAKPIVGKNYAQCALVCDNMKDCVGFAFFPSKLCFFFKDIIGVTYYTGCNTVSDENKQLAMSCSVKSELTAAQKPTIVNHTKIAECPVCDDEGVVFTSTTHLTNRAFQEGTFIMDTPGVYELEEDVVFDPQTPLSSGISSNDVHFPDPTSEKYPQLGGYYLGFFAAIAVQADDVTIDCKGHTIAMSADFHKRQRFFAIIELGSTPFIAGAGPPQFANDLLTAAPLKVPHNVSIQNCVFGLFSHHGIHGNSAQGVTLKNLKIRDFEVGGIHLNGVSKAHIENVQIGPSLKKTFHAALSQAIFLDHMMNTLLPTQPELNIHRKEATVTLRGQAYSVDEIFSKLHTDLNEYYIRGAGSLRPLFGDGEQPPDGSAIFGIVIHKTGPAVHEFGACPLSKAEEEGLMVTDFTLRDVEINDLLVDTFQMTRILENGTQVMGPAGDVFAWQTNSDANGDYVGNTLGDAQLALGAFKKYLSGKVKSAELIYYFGASHIPDSVLSWAASWTPPPWNSSSFSCMGDAMSHVNKGAVGLFLNHIEAGGATFSNVKVSNIANIGTLDADPRECVQDDYSGLDSRGVMLVNSPGVKLDGIQADSVTAGIGGKAMAFDSLAT
jgi:hypothetical protein